MLGNHPYCWQLLLWVRLQRERSHCACITTPPMCAQDSLPTPTYPRCFLDYAEVTSIISSQCCARMTAVGNFPSWVG
jgi:hypothetical protein